MRKPIFDTIRVQLGRGFTVDEVRDIDSLLDRLGIRRDTEPAAPPEPNTVDGASVEAVGLDNPASFFESVSRSAIFADSLKSDQIDGLKALLESSSIAGLPLAFTAYLLATATFETAYTVRPVREAFWLDEDWRRTHLRYYPYYGRGYVQLTWRTNYERADRELGLGGQLNDDLDLALDPVIAAKILVRGMEEGWFCADKSGRRHTMARHLPATGAADMDQFRSARRIINGTDKAGKIAGEAIMFQNALKAGGW